jgi:hypothetical protein
MVGLTATLALGLALGLAGALALGLALGIALGAALGAAFGGTAWIRYMLGCGLARRKGLLPPRVGQFLDWAYRASLLRMSGTATQFRHHELQTWLSGSAPDRRSAT